MERNFHIFTYKEIVMEKNKDFKKYQFSPISRSHPWLMFCHGRDLQRQTFFSIPEDRYYTRIIPAMRNKDIHCSTNGCLVIEDNGSHDYFLLDLVSMEIIQLPSVEFEFEFCDLWKSPSNSNCHIWFMNNDFLMSCQLGDHEYVKKEIQFEDEEFPVEDDGMHDNSILDAVVIENKMYAILLREFQLVVGDLEDSRIRFKRLTKKPLPLPSLPRTMICSSTYLIDSHKELLLVQEMFSSPFHYCDEVIDFEVFRFDRFINEWVETQNIGERSLFLSNYDGKCYDVMGSGIKINSIYFLKSKDRHLYVFDIKDRSISISLPFSNVSNSRSVLRWT